MSDDRQSSISDPAEAHSTTHSSSEIKNDALSRSSNIIELLDDEELPNRLEINSNQETAPLGVQRDVSSSLPLEAEFGASVDLSDDNSDRKSSEEDLKSEMNEDSIPVDLPSGQSGQFPANNQEISIKNGSSTKNQAHSAYESLNGSFMEMSIPEANVDDERSKNSTKEEEENGGDGDNEDSEPDSADGQPKRRVMKRRTRQAHPEYNRGLNGKKTVKQAVLEVHETIPRIKPNYARGLKRVTKTAENKVVSILTSDSSGDEGNWLMAKVSAVTRNTFGSTLTNWERESLSRLMRAMGRLDPHATRNVGYRPIRAQEFHEYDALMTPIPWYTDLSQYGIFQHTVLTQWPAPFYQPRWERFRRTESRAVHSFNPTEENLVFRNTTAEGLPYEIKAGTTVVFKHPHQQKAVSSPEPWLLPPVRPTVSLELASDDEEEECPLVKSLLPNEDICTDLLPERTGIVHDEYEGSAILGGKRSRYSAPYLGDSDIELMEQMEGEVRTAKRKGIHASHLFAEDCNTFRDAIRKALPAAASLFNIAPVDMDEDPEHLEQNTVILQSLSQVLNDSWQHLFDHYTRVERRERRLNRDKLKRNAEPAPAPSHEPTTTSTYSNDFNNDQNAEMTLIDIENDDSTENEVVSKTPSPKPIMMDESMPQPLDLSAMDVDEPIDVDGLQDLPTEKTSDENGGREEALLAEEVDQDITENVEVPDSELLKQQPGETDDDWVARLSCIIGDSFYENTLDAEVLEQMVDDEQWVAEREADQEAEYFGFTAEDSDAPARPIIMELNEDPFPSPSNQGRGRKRKLTNAEEIDPTEFGESTVPPRKEKDPSVRRTQASRLRQIYEQATATIPPAPLMLKFVVSDLRPIKPFSVSRPTHEFLVSEVSSLLTDVLNGILSQAEEVHQERLEKRTALHRLHLITKTHDIVFNELLRLGPSQAIRDQFQDKLKLLFLDHDFQKIWPTGTKDTLLNLYHYRAVGPYDKVPRFRRNIHDRLHVEMPWSEACRIVRALESRAGNMSLERYSKLQTLAIPARFALEGTDTIEDVDATVCFQKVGDDYIVSQWKAAMRAWYVHQKRIFFNRRVDPRKTELALRERAAAVDKIRKERGEETKATKDAKKAARNAEMEERRKAREALEAIAEAKRAARRARQAAEHEKRMDRMAKKAGVVIIDDDDETDITQPKKRSKATEWREQRRMWEERIRNGWATADDIVMGNVRYACSGEGSQTTWDDAVKTLRKLQDPIGAGLTTTQHIQILQASLPTRFILEPLHKFYEIDTSIFDPVVGDPKGVYNWKRALKRGYDSLQEKVRHKEESFCYFVQEFKKRYGRWLLESEIPVKYRQFARSNKLAWLQDSMHGRMVSLVDEDVRVKRPYIAKKRLRKLASNKEKADRMTAEKDVTAFGRRHGLQEVEQSDEDSSDEEQDEAASKTSGDESDQPASDGEETSSEQDEAATKKRKTTSTQQVETKGDIIVLDSSSSGSDDEPTVTRSRPVYKRRAKSQLTTQTASKPTKLSKSASKKSLKTSKKSTKKS